MLTDREKKFIQRWEMERDRLQSFSGKLLSGLPVAMLFSLPILMSVVLIYFFSPEWYTKISNTAPGTFLTVVMAVLLCIVFFSYFRMHYKWETNEQLYRELMARSKKEDPLEGSEKNI